MTTLTDILFWQAGFNTSVVLIGCTLLGASAGVVGCFAVLRQRSLVADAIGHATLPGVMLGYLIALAITGEGRRLPWLLGGAAVTGLMGVLAVQAIVATRRLREDAAIASVLSIFFGVGVLLLSYIQTLSTPDRGGLTHFILGQTAAMSRTDALMIGVVGLAAMLVVIALAKELRLVAFDESLARAQGWPVLVLDVLLMAVITAVMVVAIQVVGMLLVVAMLIIPPAAARHWSDRFAPVVILSGVLGGLAAYAGAAASAVGENIPIGAAIVLASGVAFALGLLLSPRRGVLLGAFRSARLRFVVRAQHRLRHLHAARHARPDGFIDRLLLAWLVRQGLARRNGSLYETTARGDEACDLAKRAARTWQSAVGLDQSARLSPGADAVEHVLSREMIERLEQDLRTRRNAP